VTEASCDPGQGIMSAVTDPSYRIYGITLRNPWRLLHVGRILAMQATKTHKIVSAVVWPGGRLNQY